MQESMPHRELTVIHPQSARQGTQEPSSFFGISAQSAGATAISMRLVEIAPGSQGEPHYHPEFETAIYVLAGRIETRYGEGLHESVINEAGSFLFIPPNILHQPINLNATQPALAIVARNDAREEENVVLNKQFCNCT